MFGFISDHTVGRIVHVHTPQLCTGHVEREHEKCCQVPPSRIQLRYIRYSAAPYGPSNKRACAGDFVFFFSFHLEI